MPKGPQQIPRPIANGATALANTADEANPPAFSRDQSLTILFPASLLPDL